MSLSRRAFLSGSAAGLGLLAIPRASAFAAPGQGTDTVLVVVFLRGAADALNLVVPYGDDDYYAARPTNRIAPGNVIDLDGFFGLHPGLSDLAPLYAQGQLALLHGVGSHHPTRSHFDAQDFMERAAPGDLSVEDGWLNRMLAALGGDALHAGITLDHGASLALRGNHATVAFSSIDKFRLLGAHGAERQRALERIYAADTGPWLAPAVGTALSTVDLVQSVDRTTNVVYPQWTPAHRLRDIAALIRADIGVRVVGLNLGGWDTHTDELTRLDVLTQRYAAALAAFQADLGAAASRTVCLTMSEFGRTVDENDAGGTEHGHGGVMLAMGEPVAGGRVVLANDVWPGLDLASRYQERDLAVTTDFRDVFAEFADRFFGLTDPSSVVPGLVPSADRYPGLLA